MQVPINISILIAAQQHLWASMAASNNSVAATSRLQAERLASSVRQWLETRAGQLSTNMVVNACDDSIGELKRIVSASPDLSCLQMQCGKNARGIPDLYCIHLEVKDEVPSNLASARQQYKESFLRGFVQLLDRPSLQDTSAPQRHPGPPRPLGDPPWPDMVLTTPPSKKPSNLNECSHGEDLASSSKLSHEEQVMNMVKDESAISEGWKLNGGVALVVSPEQLAKENSKATFEGEVSHREWEAELMDAFDGFDESDEKRLSQWRDGKYLVERLRKRRRESATEVASASSATDLASVS